MCEHYHKNMYNTTKYNSLCISPKRVSINLSNKNNYISIIEKHQIEQLEKILLKYNKHIWKNYMVHTDIKFQSKWSQPDIWYDDDQHFQGEYFINELLQKLYNDNLNVLIVSFYKYSIKNKLDVLTSIIFEFISTHNININIISEKNIKDNYFIIRSNEFNEYEYVRFDYDNKKRSNWCSKIFFLWC